MNKNELPIVIEEIFPVSNEIVWNVITELIHMKQWFFENIEEFESKIGFKTKFVIVNVGRVFPHLWNITEVIPFKMIKYNWKYEGYEGDSNVTFELIEQENNTKLKLTHLVLQSFPDNIPEFTRESCIEGWNYFIHIRLKKYILLNFK